MQSQAVEDYLKAIYDLQQHHGKVGTSALARRLNIAPASATDMIKKLAEMAFVTYEKYKGIELTPAGEKIALEVIRHHRLLELFLAEILGVPWDRVHDEAEKLEHVISEDLEDRIDALLGHPTVDPHGAPIPQRDGRVPHIERIPLTTLDTGHRAVISEVSDHDSALLRHVGRIGLFPRVPIEMGKATPATVTVRVADRDVELARETAQYILVRDIRDASGQPIAPSSIATTPTPLAVPLLDESGPSNTNAAAAAAAGNADDADADD